MNITINFYIFLINKKKCSLKFTSFLYFKEYRKLLRFDINNDLAKSSIRK